MSAYNNNLDYFSISKVLVSRTISAVTGCYDVNQKIIRIVPAVDTYVVFFQNSADPLLAAATSANGALLKANIAHYLGSGQGPQLNAMGQLTTQQNKLMVLSDTTGNVVQLNQEDNE